MVTQPNPPLKIAPAAPEQRAAAFRLAFQHLPVKERETRVGNALGLVERGELDPAGVFVAVAAGEPVGSLICMTAPGAGGLVWPPQVQPQFPERPAAEDGLVQAASAWLRGRGARLAQALLIPDEIQLAAPLERNGFAHVTRLWYLRHELELTSAALAAFRLTYVPYAADPARFHDTLLSTYVDSEDCPEVTGVRTIEEIIEGHRAQGRNAPERWWLALAGAEPVGVLLLSEAENASWDVSYVGVTPAMRGRGCGVELMHKALVEARVGGADFLTLSVDARNRPACRLYHRLGFERFDEREVLLAIWNRAAP